MKIVVGSKNKVKVEAVKELIVDYEMFSRAKVLNFEVLTEVSSQPMSIDETVKGAISRAVNSFGDCHYSFGIESGLMKVPHTKTGFMDVCACVIYDGEQFHMGLSSAFEYPKKIMNLVLEENIEVSEAFLKAGWTKKQKIGYHEGGIGILTKGRLLRKEYTKQAIMNALIHLENAHLF